MSEVSEEGRKEKRKRQRKKGYTGELKEEDRHKKWQSKIIDKKEERKGKVTSKSKRSTKKQHSVKEKEKQIQEKKEKEMRIASQ